MRSASIALSTIHEVRDACLCLATQRAARRLARRFDRAFKPVGLTNQQFSLLMPLNAPGPQPMGALADLMGMDRTTLTAALKALERRGLVESGRDPDDRRIRRLGIATRPDDDRIRGPARRARRGSRAGAGRHDRTCRRACRARTPTGLRYAACK